MATVARWRPTPTPFTNTLPIRHLGLEPGRAAEIVVAYVRVPELTVEPEGQRYTCLERDRRYRFESRDGEFTRDLDVDARGLVVLYPGLFRRVA
ncbi:MAG TPA: putative glycolipid-binding domain-containing protein [Methylomirabilota bacterium]|nr:putative glycolipid-binding domain-containing protein [Methylomirabilota bacterium]